MPTEITGVGLLSSVDAVMALERCQAGEGPSTLLTIEGPCPRVSLLVPLEPEQLHKGHATLLTLVGLVLPVDHLVLGQQVGLVEAFATCWAGVRLEVVFLRLWVSRTRLTWALPTVLAAVHHGPGVPGHATGQDHHGALDLVHVAQVPPDVGRADEALVTLGALVRPLAGVDELVHAQVGGAGEGLGADGAAVGALQQVSPPVLPQLTHAVERGAALLASTGQSFLRDRLQLPAKCIPRSGAPVVLVEFRYRPWLPGALRGTVI